MKNEVGIFNPDIKDFSVKYDINEDGNPVTFTAPARETSYFSPRIAHHVAKHLADFLLHKRGIKQNPDLDKQNIMEEILV